jgi:Ser/Thr protein kinase RdoA (MazF antagonist)
VVDWLLELGRATAAPTEAHAGGALSRLPALFENFARTYRLPAEQEEFLSDQVTALTRSAVDVPAVFQHGDPGPWNVLVTPDGTPAFLDWEAADPKGMPLWDLFHFLRSYGYACSRAARTRGRLRSFAEQFLDDSAFNRVLVDATRRFCADAGLAPAFVEPLFYSCWMHRALKEAATLPRDQLPSGRYFSILRLAVERRNSPGLRRLFSLSGADA